jgi:hypothetical protein
MSEQFIDDVKNLEKLDDFQKGNDKQRAHLNKLVKNINGVIEAAERDAENGGGTEEFYVIDGGESVPKNFVMG